MSSGNYTRLYANMMNKVIDLEADDIKIMLMNNSHSFVWSHNTKSQVVANEITGSGYTAGGIALANKAVTQGATTKWDADDPSWTSASFTVYHAVIWDDTVATDDLICSLDLGGAQTVINGTFTVVFSNGGLVVLT